MFFNDWLSVIFVKFLHSMKQETPSSVTLLGMTMLSRAEHFEKAASPMEMTLSGMVMDFRLVDSMKEEGPICVSVLGSSI